MRRQFFSTDRIQKFFKPEQPSASGWKHRLDRLADIEPKGGLLSYRSSNLGDDIQALAALPFLPRIDYFVDRDSIGTFEPSTPMEKVKICMNGWFLGSRSWPPPRSLDPLFVSFHLGRHHYTEYKRFGGEEFLLGRKSIAYLREHEPIGCRDFTTVQLLEKEKVKAYFSGCLTLTLNVAKREEADREEILLVEPNLDIGTLFASIPQRCKSKTAFVSHHTQLRGPPELRMNTALRILERYAVAKLVITSRLHCALPCLAFGTPVLFVPPSYDVGRLPGLAELFNPVSVNDGVIAEHIAWYDPAPNPSKHLVLAEKLALDCRRFFSPRTIKATEMVADDPRFGTS
jgi:hypothetical protein